MGAVYFAYLRDTVNSINKQVEDDVRDASEFERS